MSTDRPLRICIDARVPDGPASGGRAVLVGLAAAFSKLVDGDEEYFFLVLKDSHQWLRPYISGRCQLLPLRSGPSLLRRLARRFPYVRSLRRKLRPKGVNQPMSIPHSDGTIESTGIDLMYFAGTAGFLTKIDTVYEIHDLQYLHYPQYFAPEVLKERDYRYRELCAQAKLVVVPSEWGKRDLELGFGIEVQKIAVVPWAPVLRHEMPCESDLASVRQEFLLPQEFAFYPAHTWPHKNHFGLLEALAIIRDQNGERIPLVCSGSSDDFLKQIGKRIQELRLDDQVQFLGYVSDVQLRCLYNLCRLVVFPSFFEGWGLPLLEACSSGVPVACSNIGPFVEQAADAIVTFDPSSPPQIAEAMRTLWNDGPLRRQLIDRGRKQALVYTWDRSARLLRTHFRSVSGRALSNEDTKISTASLSHP